MTNDMAIVIVVILVWIVVSILIMLWQLADIRHLLEEL